MYVFGTPAGHRHKETAMSSYPLLFGSLAAQRTDAFMLQADQARMASVARRRRRAARAAARAAQSNLNAASIRQTHTARHAA